MRVGADTLLAAPIEDVWSIVTDPQRVLSYMSGITRWEVVGERDQRTVGAREKVDGVHCFVLPDQLGDRCRVGSSGSRNDHGRIAVGVAGDPGREPRIRRRGGCSLRLRVARLDQQRSGTP